MGVREFQGEGTILCCLGGDGGLVIYTFKLHHHHHHCHHHHHHHHHQSSDSCILKTSNLNFQPNYHFTLAGDLSPNILYRIISGFIGWSKFKHKSPSVFKERPVQRKVTRQIQPVVDILTQFFLLWIVLLNFFLKSDHSALDLPSPTTDVSHLESEGFHPDHQHHYHHHQQNKAQFITKIPPPARPGLGRDHQPA